jgi:GNAT superfamily N-acetyltransferase
MVSIEQVRPEVTWRLRRDVLYPQREIPEMAMPEDGDGFHFAAFTENKLVGVISLFQHGDDFQFRKFAVETGFQGKGIGTALLACIEEFTITNKGQRLWCNARTIATEFYQKNGFMIDSEAFRKNEIEYVIMSKRLKGD